MKGITSLFIFTFLFLPVIITPAYSILNLKNVQFQLYRAGG